MPPELLSRAEVKAAQIGVDRAKYVRSLIEEDLAAKGLKPKHKFASEDLVGCYTAETPGLTATKHGCARSCVSGTWQNVKEIADTGLIVALLMRNDRYHEWAAAVLLEAAFSHLRRRSFSEAASFFPDPWHAATSSLAAISF